jgi:Na+-driven multidrug efflux pump
MAGWSCYNKMDQFILLPMQSMAMAATTFVSQNIGASKRGRAQRGIRTTILLTLAVTGLIAAVLYVFAEPATGLFTKDTAVIEFSVLFLRTNVIFLLANCVNHTMAGALRGMGDSRGPMVIMLLCFVAVRQAYLFIITRFFFNTPRAVGFGYPVGWVSCCVIELLYYYITKKRGEAAAP